MRRLGSVQQKISCVFLTEVKNEPSTKREYQKFRVLATETLNPKVLESDIQSAVPTEKLDGTCCYVSAYKGKPYLWARLDKKPNKQTEKRFKTFQHSTKGSEGKAFVWNVKEDFRSVPESWIFAHGVTQCNGYPQPDENGHIPGWVPVENDNKQYCWHSSVVNYEIGAALVLRPHTEHQELLEITTVPLHELLEQTLELIGTNINANPYGLGSKKQPIHLLVSHGVLEIQSAPAVNYQQLLGWFQGCEEGKVEGIVWHCSDGTLIKLHRHHLGLRWPVEDPFLNSRPVLVNVDVTQYECDFIPKSLFTTFSEFNGRQFDHLKDICFE
ncbi:RNA ligase 1 isoform X1 [Acipenser ruthenus]|uniref:RNA ligase 1 isoform X1 n=1 Tax=Acipenser ruthenus TaxID=7906 RepID=UPI00145AB6A9|nr:RNA ligase 1 isoform X1 [Acipenser ruthenus]